MAWWYMTIHIYIHTCMYTILLWFTFAQYHKHYNLNSLLLLNLSCPILIVVSEQNYYTHRYIHICILMIIYIYTPVYIYIYIIGLIGQQIVARQPAWSPQIVISVDTSKPVCDSTLPTPPVTGSWVRSSGKSVGFCYEVPQGRRANMGEPR